MNTVNITIEMNKINTSDKEPINTSDFRVAFSGYMTEKNISIYKLSRLTGVSEKTISRYRKDEKGAYDIKTITALCIGLNLYIKRSLRLINLAGLSLKPTQEHDMYFDFLAYAYCSDLTVDKCNTLLINAGYEPLVVNEKPLSPVTSK